MSYTRADAIQFLKDNNYADSSAKGVRNYDRIINRACSALHQAGLWTFDKFSFRLQFAAPKTAGTVSINNGDTALAGVDTDFAAGDVDKFIRIAGNPLTYNIAAVTDALNIDLSDDYLDADAADKTYSLTQPRLALPERFRSFAKPSSGDGLYELKLLADVRDLWIRRRLEKNVGVPRYYAIEWRESSGYKVPYIWVYPDPANAYVVESFYQKWPDKIAADTDTFGVPNIEAAHVAIEDFLLAFMYREQGKIQEYQAQFAMAQANVRDALRNFLPWDEDTQRHAYVDPDEDLPVYRIMAAPGVSE